MHKRSTLLAHVIHLGSGGLISRFLGLARRMLLARFLGVSATADAFHLAFTIPNTLRRLFAEGSFNAALTPTLVTLLRKEGVHEANALITLTFLITQSLLCVVCVLLSWKASIVVHMSVPGFTQDSLGIATHLTSIMVFFALFVSANALFTSALQALHKFFIAAHSQSIMNLLFIGQLVLCLQYDLPPILLAYGTLVNGFIIALIHIAAYSHAGLSFVWPTRRTLHILKEVGKKFFPCLLTLGSTEITLFIDRIMVSYLPVGSLSLLDYAWTLTAVPLGLVMSNFATVLLPHLSTVSTYAPKRLAFYLLEASKLVIWITLPLSALMIGFARPIFQTLFSTTDIGLQWASQAAAIFIPFAAALFFFSINRLLVSIYHALHDTARPTAISFAGACITTILNVICMRSYGIVGIALANALAEVVKTFLFLLVLAQRHKVRLYFMRFLKTAFLCSIQLMLMALPFVIVHKTLSHALRLYIPKYALLLLQGWGFWLWTGPLCSALFLALYLTRSRFGIKLYLLK